MHYKIIVRPEAEEDLELIIAWYEEQQVGLSSDLLLKFEDVLNQLRQNPLIYQDIFLHYRRSLMKRFPYAVYYSIDEHERTVFVAAVIHTHRDPDLFSQRIL